MKDYTYQDMLKMQEDAAFRVREMKKRATLVMDENEEKIQPSEKLNNVGFLGTLLQDSDTVLVMAILVLVMNEKNDYLTNLALMYILL